MSTYIKEEAIEPIIRGFNMTAEATKLSMGYEGKFAFIENQFGIFEPTKDGVTIAKSVFSGNKKENVGCQLAKQICAKQVIMAGDSTTAALVFGQYMVNEGYRILNAVPAWWEEMFNSFKQPSATEFRKGMEIAYEQVAQKLKELSTPVTDEDIEAIASISANNDSEIGEILSQVYKEVGKDGMIEIEKGTGENTTYKIVKGMRLERGMKSPFFANTEKGDAELEEPYIFIFDGYVGDLRIITEVLEKTVADNRPLLLVADDFSEDALAMLLDNFQRGAMQVCPIRCPDFGNKRRHLLEDLALFTGTEVFSQGVSAQMKLGTARKISVGKEFTAISQDKYFDGVEERVSALKAQLEESPEDPEFLQQRIASLSAGVGVIFVGEKSEAARNEKKDRFDDAKHAVQSSKDEGYITGGGAALVYIAGEMDTKFPRRQKDRQMGYDTLRDSLRAPYLTIMNNAGLAGEEYIGAIEAEYGIGFNLKNRQLENLLDSNIIDSAKSIRLALDNARSISSLMLNAQVISVI